MDPLDLLDFPHPVMNSPSDKNPIAYKKLPFILIACFVSISTNIY